MKPYFRPKKENIILMIQEQEMFKNRHFKKLSLVKVMWIS